MVALAFAQNMCNIPSCLPTFSERLVLALSSSVFSLAVKEVCEATFPHSIHPKRERTTCERRTEPFEVVGGWGFESTETTRSARHFLQTFIHLIYTPLSFPSMHRDGCRKNMWDAYRVLLSIFSNLHGHAGLYRIFGEIPDVYSIS